MPKQKRALVEGDNDGEGYPWKVLKSKSGKAIHVFYGKGGDCTFRLNKEDKKAAPTAGLVLQRIGEHRQEKRKQAEGGGRKKAKASRLSAEAASLASEAESSMKPSGSKEERRVQTEFSHLHTAGRPGRDYEKERRSAEESRERREMEEAFLGIQKMVGEEMNDDGAEMCGVLTAMTSAIFSRFGATGWSPSQKIDAVAELVSNHISDAPKMNMEVLKLLRQQDEEQQQQEDAAAAAEEEEEGPVRPKQRSKTSSFDSSMTKQQYARMRTTELVRKTELEAHQQVVRELQSTVQKQKRLLDKDAAELKKQTRLIKELRLRLPGQGLGHWIRGPLQPPTLDFPQRPRSRMLTRFTPQLPHQETTSAQTSVRMSSLTMADTTAATSQSASR